jgi:hypothetical protein
MKKARYEQWDRCGCGSAGGDGDNPGIKETQHSATRHSWCMGEKRPSTSSYTGLKKRNTTYETSKYEISVLG